MKKMSLSHLVAGTSFFAGIQLIRLCKVSYVIGSYHLFFSGINVAGPLAGAFSLAGITSASLFGWSLAQYGVASLFSTGLLMFHLPTFAASLYWSVKHPIFRIGLPLLCMVIFNLHPAGSAAWFYSLWWLLPIACSFFTHRSTFVTALGSTFTAHAVGTVIWLFVHPLSPSLYLSLMPVVLVERLTFASGMVMMYHALRWAATYARSLFSLGKNIRFKKV